MDGNGGGGGGGGRGGGGWWMVGGRSVVCGLWEVGGGWVVCTGCLSARKGPDQIHTWENSDDGKKHGAWVAHTNTYSGKKKQKLQDANVSPDNLLCGELCSLGPSTLPVASLAACAADLI